MDPWRYPLHPLHIQQLTHNLDHQVGVGEQVVLKTSPTQPSCSSNWCAEHSVSISWRGMVYQAPHAYPAVLATLGAMRLGVWLWVRQVHQAGS
jgi:hypothetical protein